MAGELSLLESMQNASMMFWPLLTGAFFGAAVRAVPEQAQLVDQKQLNVLQIVEPVSVQNLSTVFVPPGLTAQAASSKPFHIYNESFHDVIGDNPSLTVIASTGIDPIFHEAVVWYPPTDEVFWVQNAGAKAAGTGLKKSNSIYKISLAQAAAVSSQQNASGKVDVVQVAANPTVVNSNGGNNYRGEIIFTAEGQGANIPSALYVMNPREPYNTTVILNNFFGRQFNSLNDVAINPKNNEVYFTDTVYGYLQDFRPTPGFPDQVYRFNPDTGAVSVVASDFGHCNGITFSPDGSYAYIADSGALDGFYGTNLSAPSTIYRFAVESDGTFSERKVFAFPSPGVPDGVHCDTKGNVYAGCGDGVHVWNPSGLLLGKIWTGMTVANFNFAGKGRMVICAETELFYATLAAEGAVVASQMPSS